MGFILGSTAIAAIFFVINNETVVEVKQEIVHVDVVDEDETPIFVAVPEGKQLGIQQIETISFIGDIVPNDTVFLQGGEIITFDEAYQMVRLTNMDGDVEWIQQIGNHVYFSTNDGNTNYKWAATSLFMLDIKDGSVETIVPKKSEAQIADAVDKGLATGLDSPPEQFYTIRERSVLEDHDDEYVFYSSEAKLWRHHLGTGQRVAVLQQNEDKFCAYGYIPKSISKNSRYVDAVVGCYEGLYGAIYDLVDGAVLYKTDHQYVMTNGDVLGALPNSNKFLVSSHESVEWNTPVEIILQEFDPVVKELSQITFENRLSALGAPKIELPLRVVYDPHTGELNHYGEFHVSKHIASEGMNFEFISNEELEKRVGPTIDQVKQYAEPLEVTASGSYSLYVGRSYPTRIVLIVFDSENDKIVRMEAIPDFE